MKKLFLALFAIAVMAGCSEKPQTISGKLSNLEDGEVVLEKYNRKGNEEVAKANLVNGSFSITYTPGQTDLYMLKTEKKSIPFFLDQNSVTMKGDIESVDEIEITGSVAHDEYRKHYEALKPLSEKEQEIIQTYRAAAAKQDGPGVEKAEAEYDAIQIEKNEAVKNHLKQNPGTAVSAFLARMTFGYESDVKVLKELIDMLDPALAGNSYYDYMTERYTKLENVAVGKMAPDFELNDPDGKPVKLSSLRGKYILMDFWASWCGPCRRENPNVVALYNTYKDRNFDIIGISLDKDKDKWLEAIAADGLTWNHVSDLKYWDSMAADLYAVSGIPHTVLLDPEGRIIAKNLRGKELKAKLAELLD